MSKRMVEYIKTLSLRELPELYSGVSEHDPKGSGWCRSEQHVLQGKNPAIINELFENFEVKAALEIGVCFGAGIDVLRHFGGEDFLIVGIDPMYKPKKLIEQGMEYAKIRKFDNPKTVIIQKESSVALNDVKTMLAEHKVSFFDIIVVDGDHSYETALGDLIMYSQLLNPTGVIYWDDTDKNEVINELRYFPIYRQRFEVFGFGLELDASYNCCWIGIKEGTNPVPAIKSHGIRYKLAMRLLGNV